MTKYFLPVFFLIGIVYTVVAFVTGHLVTALVLGSLVSYNMVMTYRVAKYKLDADRLRELQ